MKGIRIYGIIVAALLAFGLVWITLSQSAGTAGPLRMLGKGEGDYRRAREKLLLNTYDVVPVLVRFASNNRNSVLARTQALRILQGAAFHASLDNHGNQIAGLLSEQSPALRMEALITLEKFRTPASVSEIVRVFHGTTDTGLFHQSRRTLMAGVEVLRTRLGEALRTDDTVAVDSCIAIFEQLPVGRCTAYRMLSEHYQRTGNLERAAMYMRRAGLIAQWWLAGPLRSVKFAGYDTDYGPEARGFDPAFACDDGAGGHQAWQRLTDGMNWGFLNSRGLFNVWEDFAIYLGIYLHSPTDRRALLMVGWDDAMKVWLNGAQVFEERAMGSPREDDAVVKVDLRQGVNTLLIKVVQGTGHWGMFCRLTDTSGVGMDDLAVSLERLPVTTGDIGVGPR